MKKLSIKEKIELVINGTHLFIRNGNNGMKITFHEILNEYKGHCIIESRFGVRIIKISIGQDLSKNHSIFNSIGNNFTLDNYKQAIDISEKINPERNNMDHPEPFSKHADAMPINQLTQINNKKNLQLLLNYQYNLQPSFTKEEFHIIDNLKYFLFDNFFLVI